MNAAQLREAGFDDNEIREYLSRKHVELKAAGFSDAEIEARFGPTPASPPEPPPFDLEKHFKGSDQAPPETSGLDAGDVMIGSAGPGKHNSDDLVLSEVLFDNFVKPWLAVGYTAAAALNRGMVHFGNNLDSLAEYIGQKTGTEPSHAFAAAAKMYDENREYWQKRANEVGVTFLQELFGEATGGALPGIAEFMLNIPYAAALGAAKGAKKDEAAGSDLPTNEIGSAITEAAKRGILGKVFHAIAPLKRYLQAPVMAGTFGAQAAFEGGDVREVAKGIGTGLIYAAAAPGGRYGLNEIRELNRKNLSDADRYNQAIQKWIAADLNKRLAADSIYTPEEITGFRNALEAFDAQRRAAEGLTVGEVPGEGKKTPLEATERAVEGKPEGEAGGERPPEVKIPEAPPEVGPEPRVEPAGPDAPGAVLDPGKFPVQRIKVADIGTNVEKMQFKLDVDAQGVQKELQGEWNELAAGNLLLWQNRKGELIVANGHHRLALARKMGVVEVHAQILRERDGFTMEDARRLAAEANILEGKGTIYDHAEYFRLNPEYTPELARARGLAGQGFAIGRLATDRTYDLFRNRKISPEAAEAISRAAPGDEVLQAAGARFAVEKPKADAYEITSMMQALSLESRPASEQADLFGFDDSAIRQAAEQAKIVAGEIRNLRDQINAVRGAAKRPEVAKKLGVDVKNPEAIRRKIQELQAEVEAWQSWCTNPELVTKVREKSGYVPETVEAAKVLQQAKNLDELYLLAEKAYPELMEASNHLADKYGGSVHERPETDRYGRKIAYVPAEGVRLKSKESAARKLEKEEIGAVERLTDIAGTSVVFEDYATMLRALSELTRLYRGKIWFRNTFEKRNEAGYGDINCRIQTENGTWMEIQLHKRSLFEAKEALGHLSYEVTRELLEAEKRGNKEVRPDIAKVNELTRRYYSEAESKDSASSLETTGILSQTLRDVCESSIGTSFLKESTRNAVIDSLSQANTRSWELTRYDSLSGSLPGIESPPFDSSIAQAGGIVKEKLTGGKEPAARMTTDAIKAEIAELEKIAADRYEELKKKAGETLTYSAIFIDQRLTPDELARWTDLTSELSARQTAELGGAEGARQRVAEKRAARLKVLEGGKGAEPRKIIHFTLPENVEKILREGFNAELPPLHGAVGLAKAEKYTPQDKLGGPGILYFTTDAARWSKASIYVGEGNGTKDYTFYDYENQKFVTEKNALKVVNLAPIEATVKANAKILTLDSLEKALDFQAKYMGGSRYTRDVLGDLLPTAKNLGYDVVEIRHEPGKWDLPGGKTNRYGERDAYLDFTGNSGKNDFFILRPEAIEVQRPGGEIGGPGIKSEKVMLEGGIEAEQGIIPGAGVAETFGLTPAPGEVGAPAGRTPAPSQGGLFMAPEAGFRRTPEKGGEAEKPMSRSEIRQFLEEKLDIPIRTGRFIGKALGIFKPRSEVIRTRYANDIEVIAHEVGHALHKYLWPETMTRKGLSAQPFQAFAHELNQIATRPRAGQDVATEGYAEFVRLYITDPAQAQRKAPDFYRFFEAQLDLKAPEVKEIFLEARAKYQKFIEQPPLQRILSQISIGKSDKVPRNLDELYTMAMDDLHPLELAVKEMAQGRQIPASKDPYKLARLLRGWHGKAEAFLKHAPFSFGDYQDIPGAKSLKQILEPVRDNLDEFRAYIVAKRALELADRKVETGIYRSDAEAIVNMYESRFRETHRELLDYQDLTLKYLLDAGLLTPEAYAKMKIWNRDYVPFYRVMENTKGQGTGVGLEGRNPVKQIRGSWRDIVDPLESIIKNTFLYINLAEKNAVGRALVELERSGDGLGKFVEKIPMPMKKTTVTPEEIARYIENLAERLGFEAKELPADMFDALEIFRPSAFVPKDNVIQVWENGKRSLYQVDPEIGRVFKALDREDVNFLVKVLSYPAQWLRAGATLTPEFIGRNPIRDQWSAFCYSKYGFVPGFDLIRGIFSMVKKDQAYWDFKKAGADHSMLVSLDRDYLQDNLGDLLQKYPIRNVIKNPINGLRMLSELGEMGTRLGEFKRGLAKEALRRDLSESTAGAPSKGELAEAAFSAREVTLDFARMGAKTKAANALIAFWNAQLQGTDRFVRAFQDNPLGTTVKVAASITLPSVLLAIANHDDPRYKELPQWQKDLFWIVITDKTVWRIPKPFELGLLFGSVPERITHYILDQDPHAFDNLADTLLRAASPGVIPTIQAPFVENWANRSLFFDRNLVPRSREDLLPEYQYSDHTTETAKLLSAVVGRFPGLDQWKGAAPAYIENLIYGWSGGLGRYALQIADAGLKASGAVEEKFQKPAATLADIPFVKAFVVRYPSAQAESIQRFYDNYEKALAVNKTIKVLMEKEQNPEAAAKLWQSSGMADLQGIKTALSNAHNTIDLIYRNPDMTPDEKRELIDQIYMQMIAMAQNGNKLAESFEKARKEEVERQKNRGIVKERAPASVAAQPRTPPPPGPESRPVQF